MSPWLQLLSAGLLLAILVNSPQPRVANAPTCRLKVELLNCETGQAVPGLVQTREVEGNLIELAGLLDRGLGLQANSQIHE